MWLLCYESRVKDSKSTRFEFAVYGFQISKHLLYFFLSSWAWDMGPWSLVLGPWTFWTYRYLSPWQFYGAIILKVHLMNNQRMMENEVRKGEQNQEEYSKI